MLTLEETRALVEVLESGGSSLLDLSEQFFKAFPPEAFPRVALGLRCLLEDAYYGTQLSVGFDPTGQCAGELLVCYFLLYLLSVTHPPRAKDDLPLILPGTRSVLYEQLQKLEAFIREKRQKKDKPTEVDSAQEEAIRVKTVLKLFILQCVTNKMDEALRQQTPAGFLAASMKDLEAEFEKLAKEPELLREKLRELQALFDEERRNSLGGFLGKGVSPLLAVADGVLGAGGSADQSSILDLPCRTVLLHPHHHSAAAAGAAANGAGGAAAGFGGFAATAAAAGHGAAVLRFEPMFHRPAPRLLPLDGELVFLHSDGYYSDLVLDGGLLPSPELHELVTKAYKTRLTSEQTRQVLAALERDPGMVHRMGLAPQRMQGLVENCHPVAQACLGKLVQTGHGQLFLASLVALDLSLPTIEVVSGLMGDPQLFPRSFLLTFLANTLHHVQTLQDKAQQQRLVRLVAVFMHGVLRDKVLTEQDVFQDSRVGVEMLQFCLDWSKVAEIARCYKLLRAMESGQGGSGPASSLASTSLPPATSDLPAEDHGSP